MIEMKIDDTPLAFDVRMSKSEMSFDGNPKEQIVIQPGVGMDYEKLKNIPSINETPLIGNYNEIDPTVPDWAKADDKPKYTAEEVSGVLKEGDEMDFADIKDIWDTFFNS